MDIDVSIVVPTYRGAQGLATLVDPVEETLESERHHHRRRTR